MITDFVRNPCTNTRRLMGTAGENLTQVTDTCSSMMTDHDCHPRSPTRNPSDRGRTAKPGNAILGFTNASLQKTARARVFEIGLLKPVRRY